MQRSLIIHSMTNTSSVHVLVHFMVPIQSNPIVQLYHIRFVIVAGVSDLGDTIVVVVVAVVVVAVPLLVCEVSLPSLLDLSPRGVPVRVVLPPLLVLPPRLTIRPSTLTISAASSKLSSSMPSRALYTSAMACFASRRQAVGSCKQS